jgi:hypothetical protein
VRGGEHLAENPDAAGTDAETFWVPSPAASGHAYRSSARRSCTARSAPGRRPVSRSRCFYPGSAANTGITGQVVTVTGGA